MSQEQSIGAEDVGSLDEALSAPVPARVATTRVAAEAVVCPGELRIVHERGWRGRDGVPHENALTSVVLEWRDAGGRLFQADEFRRGADGSVLWPVNGDVAAAAKKLAAARTLEDVCHVFVELVAAGVSAPPPPPPAPEPESVEPAKSS